MNVLTSEEAIERVRTGEFVLLDTTKRRLLNDITGVIAQSLHHQEGIDDLDLSACTAAEITNAHEGWKERYMNDHIFHARVEMLVANIMQTIFKSRI